MYCNLDANCAFYVYFGGICHLGDCSVTAPIIGDQAGSHAVYFKYGKNYDTLNVSVTVSGLQIFSQEHQLHLSLAAVYSTKMCNGFGTITTTFSHTLVKQLALTNAA